MRLWKVTLVTSLVVWTTYIQPGTGLDICKDLDCSITTSDLLLQKCCPAEYHGPRVRRSNNWNRRSSTESTGSVSTNKCTRHKDCDEDQCCFDGIKCGNPYKSHKCRKNVVSGGSCYCVDAELGNEVCEPKKRKVVKCKKRSDCPRGHCCFDGFECPNAFKSNKCRKNLARGGSCYCVPAIKAEELCDETSSESSESVELCDSIKDCKKGECCFDGIKCPGGKKNKCDKDRVGGGKCYCIPAAKATKLCDSDYTSSSTYSTESTRTKSSTTSKTKSSKGKKKKNVNIKDICKDVKCEDKSKNRLSVNIKCCNFDGSGSKSSGSKSRSKSSSRSKSTSSGSKSKSKSTKSSDSKSKSKSSDSGSGSSSKTKKKTKAKLNDICVNVDCTDKSNRKSTINIKCCNFENRNLKKDDKEVEGDEEKDGSTKDEDSTEEDSD